jgi:hypothetical protein
MKLGKGSHFFERFENELDVVWINNVAWQNGGIHQGVVSNYNAGKAQHFKHLIFNGGATFFAYAFSEQAQGGGMKESLEADVGNIAKKLHVSVFLDLFHDLAVAEFAKSGKDENGGHDAEGYPIRSRLVVIKFSELAYNRVPWNDLPNDDKLVGAILDVRFNPFGRESLFKGFFDHVAVSFMLVFSKCFKKPSTLLEARERVCHTTV